jgi:hypothetical protein
MDDSDFFFETYTTHYYGNGSGVWGVYSIRKSQCLIVSRHPVITV